jgi:hypothetical protein
MVLLSSKQNANMLSRRQLNPHLLPSNPVFPNTDPKLPNDQSPWKKRQSSTPNKKTSLMNPRNRPAAKQVHQLANMEIVVLLQYTVRQKGVKNPNIVNNTK